MAVSSVSSSVNAPQPQAPQKTDADKSGSETSSQAASTPAPNVLTQGASAAHHHKKKVHPALPGQPGYQVNKSA